MYFTILSINTWPQRLLEDKRQIINTAVSVRVHQTSVHARQFSVVWCHVPSPERALFPRKYSDHRYRQRADVAGSNKLQMVILPRLCVINDKQEFHLKSGLVLPINQSKQVPSRLGLPRHAPWNLCVSAFIDSSVSASASLCLRHYNADHLIWMKCLKMFARSGPWWHSCSVAIEVCYVSASRWPIRRVPANDVSGIVAPMSPAASTHRTS